MLSIIFPDLCRADTIEFLLAVPALTLPVCSFHQYKLYLYEIDAVLISTLWLNLYVFFLLHKSVIICRECFGRKTSCH